MLWALCPLTAKSREKESRILCVPVSRCLFSGMFQAPAPSQVESLVSWARFWKSSRGRCKWQGHQRCWGREAPALFFTSLLLPMATAPQLSVPTPKCYTEHSPFWSAASSPPRSSNHPQTPLTQSFKQLVIGAFILFFFLFHCIFLPCVLCVCSIYVCTCLFIHAYWYL